MKLYEGCKFLKGCVLVNYTFKKTELSKKTSCHSEDYMNNPLGNNKSCEPPDLWAFSF